MTRYTARFPGGETIAIRQLAADEWPCPICGIPWPYPPITPARDNNDISHIVDGDICDGCNVEYGTQVFYLPHAPLDGIRRQLIWFRVQWLDRVGWSESALRQLHDNLGITEDEARRQAVEVAQMRQEYAKRRAERDDKGPKKP